MPHPEAPPVAGPSPSAGLPSDVLDGPAAAACVRGAVPPPPPPPSDNGALYETEEQKRVSLRRMRRVATSMLVGAALVFIAAHAFDGFWAELVKAIAEASMVGGLADWFAVTALFRHPMGLPIPHTAIIPANKLRLGRSLGNFVQRHFLRPEYVAQEMAKIDVARLAGAWLSDPENPERVTRAIVRHAPAVLERLGDERIREFVRLNVMRRVGQADFAPLLRRFLTLVLRDENPRRIVQAVLDQVGLLLEANEALLVEGVRGQVPFLLRVFRVPEMGVEKTRALLAELRQNPDHPLRRKLVAGILRALRRQQHSPEAARWMNNLKRRLTTHPETRQVVSELWTQFLDGLRDDLAAPESQIRLRIRAFATELGQNIIEQDTFRHAVNEGVRDFVVTLADTQGGAIVKMIEGRVAAWSNQEVIDRIEVNVGKDLQYVRINGTVVGGLVGGLLFLATYFLG